MQAYYDALMGISDADQLLPDEPMSRHTTFRVGGKADMMYFPKSEDQLMFALSQAGAHGIPAMVMGNGSNMIVRDCGVRGLVLVLG